MKIETYPINNLKIAEIITDEVVLSTPEEGLDFLGNLYYQGFDGIMIHKENITSDFFDLKTKIAGEILQKFVQYQMPLIIIGDFSQVSSKSLQDFIYESNTGRQVNFLSSRSEAIQAFSRI
ncbi:DUF4180 domain-containing protein [uncultured Chryseobacterium sp.]|uniref:DUF4180 domain-containing protein n=1 Tax=uncultured Chryseobacterium sp. TaxID=259322 RepID=UPI0025EF23CD|nr:DUF4180 domain-containing protein [uncultured Chryseobacterium sp.]